MFTSTYNLKHALAKATFEYIKNNSQDTYFFMGKSSKWNDTDTVIDINSNIEQEKIISKELLLLYKMNSNNVSISFDRQDWNYGSIFPQYNPENSNEMCYVITTEFKVYKCISNNNETQSSTVPSHRTFGSVEYSDGYIWKYLYTLTGKEINQFITSTKVPIALNTEQNYSKNLTEFNAIPGTIDRYDVINTGSGYSNAVIEIIGNGINATANAVIENGKIIKIIPNDIGVNYTNATVRITGDGVGASYNAVISPLAGHGSDLIKELNASSITISMSTASDLGDSDVTPKTFDYRKIGILNNVADSTSTVNKFSLPMCHVLTVENSLEFEVGDLIELNNVSAVIVYKEIINNVHHIYINELTSSIKKEELNNMFVYKSSDKTVFTNIINCTYAPAINKNFNILYIAHIDKKIRFEYTLDLIRVVIEF